MVALVFLTGCGEKITSPDRGNDENGIWGFCVNYPNPFNPITIIRFALAEDGWVKLEIANIDGHRIAVLKDGELPAGMHCFTWNAENESPGVYIVKLQANEYIYYRKITLY